MHTLTLILLLFAGLFLSTNVLADDDSSDDSSSDDDSSSHDADNPLHGTMEHVGKSFARLDRAFRGEPVRAQTRQYVIVAETMLKHLEAATNMIPARIRALPVGQRKNAAAAYSKDIRATTETTRKLVTALKTGNLKAAAALIKVLKQQRRAGHDKYQEEDEE
jgi:hypothetical protein